MLLLIFLTLWQLFARWRMLVFAGLIGVVSNATAFAEPASYPVEMLNDAALHSVHFVNADRGWAVGDRGAIWHTQDGGRNWQLQISPVACRLDDVFFADELRGWAVGGWTHPYTQRTIGVVLRTEDGGQQWNSVPDQTLPRLRSVRFADAKRGWAAGAGSALYPTGMFWTDDGGRSWTPVPKGPASSWTAVAWNRGGNFVAAGANGKASHGVQVRNDYGQVEKETAVPFLGVALDDNGQGWMVGPNGAIRRTVDGGRSWRIPLGALPSFVHEFDFQTVAMRGSHAWIAGSPATLIFHTADDGQTWEAFPTERAAPLHAIHFLDEQRGWAVGALGAILTTRDGGQTWLLQRSGGSRAAMLGMFSEPQRVPWEWFASASGNDAYLSALEILTTGDPRRPAEAFAQRMRAHEAIVAVGGSEADQSWKLPSPPEEIATAADIQKFWQQHAGPDAASKLEERLVKRIRQWRPEVVLTEDVSPRGTDPLGHLTNQIVLAAVQKAADPGIYSEQISLLGLEPWAVRKVVAPRPGEARGTFSLSPAQLAPRLGKSIGEAAEAGRSLVSPHMQISSGNLAAAVLVDSLPQGLGRQDLFSGLSLRPESDARRRLTDTIGGGMDALTRLSQKRHNIQQLIAHTQGDSAQAATWLGQVGSLTAGMSDRAAGEVLFQLGQRYQEAGKWDLAAEAFTLLVQTHPKHPLTEPAALWLLRYYASQEIAWREQRATKYDVQVAAFNAPTPTVEEEEERAADGAKKKAMPRATAAELKTDAARETAPQFLQQYHARLVKAAAVAQLLERTRPAFYAEPSVRFPLATTLRHNGSGGLSQRVLEPIQQSDAQGWSKIAATETWLAAATQGKPPAPMLQVMKARTPPQLDGRMDDEVWQSSKATQLVSTGADGLLTLVVLAYDEDYLYLAASCRRAKGKDYPPLTAQRTHDADLSANDRLEIGIDVDRDYAIAWQLALDYNGRPAESIAGDKTWNPEWFIAASGDDQYWTIEAAIPREELAATAPQAKDAWAINIRRVVPHVGTQSLSGERGTDFCGGGLLMFGE